LASLLVSAGEQSGDRAAAGLLLDQRLERLIATFGNNHVAELLGVSPSQPSRWRKGDERVSHDKQRRLLDLDYVMARLLQLFPREQADIWLTSHNAHLGARPIDVLRLRGASAVVLAIDAEAQDAYA
jgi:transcriptional regulator with XRE-family HTH domain